MEIDGCEIRYILCLIGKNTEIRRIVSNRGTLHQYIRNSLWFNTAYGSSTTDYLYSIQIGSMMVCFPEYIILAENRDSEALYFYSLALCYLFPERVSNACVLDALSPIHKSYYDMLKEIMLAFYDKLDSLSREYAPLSCNLIEHFDFLQHIIDDGILSEDKLKRCLDVLFHNFTFD